MPTGSAETAVPIFLLSRRYRRRRMMPPALIFFALGLHDPLVHLASFDRPNIRYTLVEKFKPSEQLLHYIKSRQGSAVSFIAPVANARTEEVADLLKVRHQAACYHAGLPAEERAGCRCLHPRRSGYCGRRGCLAWALINQCAFCRALRYPENIESYYQETGRAGRDNACRRSVVLFDPADIERCAAC